MVHSKTEILQAMARNPWFGSLALAERKAMVDLADVVPVHAGEMLYRKGDPPGPLLGVLSGAVKVSSMTEDGREGILSILERGNWFGEASLLDGLPRPYDATAVTAGALLVIRPAHFERLMRRNAFARAIALLQCSRLRVLYGLVEDTMVRSTAQRVVRRLLVLARGDATVSPKARASVPVSQEALAMMLGMTRQTLSKELKALVRDGILVLGYGRIDIVSLAALEERGAAR
jgi:CRP/FNR family transcriptional regulator, cyclic AMP receptor protein